MSYIVFQIPGEDYVLYDREINRLIPIEDIDACSLLGRFGEKAKEESTKRFQSQGFCQPTNLKEISHPDIPYLSQLLSHRMGEMVLQVTQNCNLRCNYCVYSGGYYNRTHTAKRMSRETAFRAVDFLMDHSMDRKAIHLGFYGGEPLLEIDLIREIINYIEKEYEGKEVAFGITTNATLLSDEITDYLVEKKFDILVSLDGPKEYQNEQRCFASGEGSYDIVFDNLRRFSVRYPQYFGRIRINAVVPPQRDVKRILNFFGESDVFKDLAISVANVSDIVNKEAIEYDESFDQTILIECTKIFLYGLNYLKREDINPAFLTTMGDLAYTYKLLMNSGKLPETSHPGGPCTPGVRRVFVDVSGRFFPCERVGESEQMQIGSLENGFDETKIKKILNVGVLTEKQCKDCWAFSMCIQCIALSLEGEEVCPKKRLSRCSNIRNRTLTHFRDIAFLLQQGFDFEKFDGTWEK